MAFAACLATAMVAAMVATSGAGGAGPSQAPPTLRHPAIVSQVPAMYLDGPDWTVSHSSNASGGSGGPGGGELPATVRKESCATAPAGHMPGPPISFHNRAPAATTTHTKKTHI